jgi:HEAT repeat protein
MGLLDIFSKQSKLKRLGKRLTEKFGPPENRIKAIDVLASMGTPEAFSTLLLRFTVSSDSRITDAEEKDKVYQYLVEAGEPAVAPLRNFLRQRDQVAWPLKILSELLSPDEVLALVLAELVRLGGEYTRDPEKRVQLIGWLLENHPEADPRVSPALLAFLGDMSDDVKLVAVRGLAQHPSEEAREPLLAALVDPEQSARVRQELLATLAQLELGVQGYREKVEALVAEGGGQYLVDKSGVIKKR